MPRKIIGIGHRARTGKDWAAKILVSEFGFTRLKFADALYEMAGNILGLDLASDEARDVFKECEFCYMEPRAGIDVTKFTNGRHFLTWLGTDLLRRGDPDIWIKLLQAKLVTLPQDARVVITDLRFVNEHRWLQSQGGVYWRVDRPKLGPLGAKAHSSETELLGTPPDAVLPNLDNGEYPAIVRYTARRYLNGG